MVPNNGDGPGDAPAPKKKRAPGARKRAAKTVRAAEQGATAVDGGQAEAGGRSAAPTPPAPQEQADGTDRNRKDTAVSRDAVSTPRAADQGDAGDPRFGEAQAERAAELAKDLKSWMDTRREDKDAPREVL